MSAIKIDFKELEIAVTAVEEDVKEAEKILITLKVMISKNAISKASILRDIDAALEALRK